MIWVMILKLFKLSRLGQRFYILKRGCYKPWEGGLVYINKMAVPE